jgi:hypothetical protein
MGDASRRLAGIGVVAIYLVGLAYPLYLLSFIFFPFSFSFFFSSSHLASRGSKSPAEEGGTRDVGTLGGDWVCSKCARSFISVQMETRPLKTVKPAIPSLVLE